MSLALIAQLALAAPLSLTATDGTAIAASHDGSGEAGIVLVHGKDGSHDDWTSLSAKLSSSGFQVVAIDLRGHGASGGAPLQPEDYLSMTSDVSAAAAWLRANGAGSVAVIGTELGANVALNAAATDTTIDNLLLLSPGLNHEGVKVGAAVGAYTGPLLIVAGKSDLMGNKAATILGGRATGPKHIELAPTSAKGLNLLNSVPGLDGLMISWINGSFNSAADPASIRPEIGSEASDQLETTGTRLEDRR
jgi:pimeloyl-ACP methyl ester carboxylesterase